MSKDSTEHDLAPYSDLWRDYIGFKIDWVNGKWTFSIFESESHSIGGELLELARL